MDLFEEYLPLVVISWEIIFLINFVNLIFCSKRNNNNSSLKNFEKVFDLQQSILGKVCTMYRIHIFSLSVLGPQ